VSPPRAPAHPDRSITMNSTIPASPRIRSGTRSRTGRIAVLLALATLATGLPVRAAFADHDDENRGNYQGNGQGHGNGNGHRNSRGRYHRGHSYAVRPGYGYPVYAPPPVYYPPVVSPGITLFFPIEIH
jgi:hypothetical protein